MSLPRNCSGVCRPLFANEHDTCPEGEHLACGDLHACCWWTAGSHSPLNEDNIGGRMA